MQMPNDNGSKKPRNKKEGSKPLGRPKMRNPDGTLVHPPKMKRLKDSTCDTSTNASVWMRTPLRTLSRSF